MQHEIKEFDFVVNISGYVTVIDFQRQQQLRTSHLARFLDVTSLNIKEPMGSRSL